MRAQPGAWIGRSRRLAGRVVRRMAGRAPAPAHPSPAGAADPLATALAEIAREDLVRQPQLDMLDAALAAAPERLRAAGQILDFFAMRPEKCRLLCGSRLFASRNPRSVSLRLAIVAADYADGRAARSLPVCRELMELADPELACALLSRAVEQAEGLAAEAELLRAGLERWPESYLLNLHMIDCRIRGNDVAGANALIGRFRDRIAADLAEEIAVARVHQADLEQAIAEERLHFPEQSDIYDDAFCRLMWAGYYESFTSRNPRQHGDALLAETYREALTGACGNAELVLDFGTMCADPIYRTALAMPGATFQCWDRQELIAELNGAAYDLPNLQFRAGDIAEGLAEAAGKPGPKVFTHMRTATVMYPHFMMRLYEDCARAGIDRIVLIEGAGMRRTTLEFCDFEAMPALSVGVKHKLYLHDYRGMLQQAGYRVAEWRRLPSVGLWRGVAPDAYLGSQYLVVAEWMRPDQ